MSRLKIFYDVEGWAYHHDAKAHLKHAPSDFEVSIVKLQTDQDGIPVLGDTPPDIICLYTYWAAVKTRKVLDSKGWPTRLVTSFNTGWPDKLEQFTPIQQASDLVVINNTRTWTQLDAPDKSITNPNGVDLDIFKVTRPVSGRRHKVIWMGSELHSELKGYDEILLPVQQALLEKGIDCELLLVDSYSDDKRTQAEMAEWYNDGTIYICASETEGTPNGALEAAACGCTIVSTRVGNMTELIRNGVNGHLVDRNVDGLLRGIECALDNYTALSQQMQSDIKQWSWEYSANAFYNSLRHYLLGETRDNENHPVFSPNTA